jgi:hypothetical protein
MYLFNRLLHLATIFLHLLLLGITPNIYADVQQDISIAHCAENSSPARDGGVCGTWLVGSVFLQPNSIQWVGNVIAESFILKEVFFTIWSKWRRILCQ